MENLEWIEGEPPPDARNPKRDWLEVAATLKEYPGKWALILRDDHAYASRIVRGTLAGFRPYGAFEARSALSAESKARGEKGNEARFDTWARYVGLPQHPRQ